MQSLVQGFIFRRINTPIHTLDPRVKLLISSILFLLSITSDRVFGAFLILAATYFIAAIAKILRRLSATLVYISAFAVFIFVTNALTLWDFRASVVFTLRFVAIVSATSLFFLTTPPDELQHVLRWLRLPRDFVFAFVTAVRFVPVFILDAAQIMDAQKSRGLEVESGGPFKRARNLIPVLVPLLVTAFLRSAELAEAMESRAYGAVDKPTSIHQLKMKSRDWIVAAASLFLFIVSNLYLQGTLQL